MGTAQQRSAYPPAVANTRVSVPLPAVLAIALLSLLAYFGVQDCGFTWDDDDYVLANPNLRSWHGLWAIWAEPRSLPQYYPLVHTSFWLEWQCWGSNALGYHLVNVALHACAAVLFGQLLARLAVPGAWAAALWFCAHPMHVESVAWITERKNLLSLVCALAAAHAYASWRSDPQRRWLVRAALWFLAALASKSVTATLPGAWLVLVWWQDGRIGKRDAWPLGLGLLLGALAAWNTAWLEAVHVGAGDAVGLHGLERLLVLGRAPWHYLHSILWPFGNCFNYPRWELAVGSLAQWSWLLVTLAALAVAGSLRARLGRSTLTVLLLFGGTLLPVLGLFDVYPFRFSFVADHFAYHASLPMLAAIANLAQRGVVRWSPRARAALAVVIALLLATLASRLVPNYRSEEVMWQATLRCHPTSTLALANLAGKALARGELDRAETLSQQALAADPNHPESLANLGAIAHHRRDLARAEQYYERARALRPNFATNLRNLGMLWHEQGRSQDALPLVQRAVELDGEYLDGRTLLVTLYQQLRQWRECLAAADWVLAFRPEIVSVRLHAAEAALELRDFALAEHHANLALRQVPGLAQARAVLTRARQQR